MKKIREVHEVPMVYLFAVYDECVAYFSAYHTIDAAISVIVSDPFLSEYSIVDNREKQWKQ